MLQFCNLRFQNRCELTLTFTLFAETGVKPLFSITDSLNQYIGFPLLKTEVFNAKFIWPITQVFGKQMEASSALWNCCH